MTFRRLLVCVALEDELDAQMESPDNPPCKAQEGTVQQFTVSKDTGSFTKQVENVSFFFFSLFLDIQFFCEI
jgi:hypothetical protein